MVRRERRTEADAEHRELQAEEGTGFPGRQQQIERGHIAGEPRDHDRGVDAFQPARVPAQQVPQARRVQAEPFQRQQWKEEPALACGEPLTESSALRDRIRGEGDGLELDVGILVDLVRRVVVPGMLRPPPGHTHAGDRAREDACRPVVPGRGVEDLPMRAVMAEERDLHEDECERNGQHQLEPGVAEQDHADGDGQQRRQDHADPGEVVALAPPQQAELPHSLEEIRVQADVPLLGAHAVIIKNHRDARRAVRWTGEVGWAKCISS